MKRRNFVAGLAAAFTAGCSKIGDSQWFGSVVDGAETLHRLAQRGLGGRDGLAREYSPADISPFFRGNGSTDVDSDAYRQAQAEGFANWRLGVTGLVDRELSLSMDALKALPQRTQITRHDCVEGWSAIGQWTGPQLGTILREAGVKPAAQYVVFRCADTLGGAPYYESVDMVDALHPQTVVAHSLNGEPLPVANGAPLRVRIERQLGYKSAKYLTGIEVVSSLDGIGEGHGGYWEDRAGYQWYAGT
ncbi:molybdopterin-binding protein [Altererythrobacter sp. B11]|uniref:molybdopterin-dependent oxidoreductase n=1 Tax=Altererythrobacter sp. B11 TaxID=2060312 RepID=UPI000DC7370B|nr:molybdopterin-dependent oxidoreductase [Altererythrobacter sp. B11]BBC72557.1 molybdopterin-binding protein [Altererythrobacter sp. B11]